MMTSMNGTMKSRLFFGLVPVLVVALLAGLAFVSCDVGDEPDGPTGPGSTYDPDFDEAQPGVTARVSPSQVMVPDPITGDAAKVSMVGIYLDPDGIPQAGLQMNFTADPVNPNVTFRPSKAFTNSQGMASTEVVIDKSSPEGSLTLVAFTSPASGGPNARGQATVYVDVGEIVSTPTVPSGNTSPADLIIGPGVSTGPVTYTTGGSASNLGNPIAYRFDCGNGVVTALAAAGSGQCTFTAAGSFQVRAQAQSSTGVTSNWSTALTVTVTDTP